MHRFRVLGLVLFLAASGSFAADVPELVVRVTETTSATGPLPAPATDNLSTAPEPCNDASGGQLFFEYFGSCHANLSRTLLYPIGGAAVQEDGHIRTRMVCDDISYITTGFPPYFSGYIVNGVTAGFGVIGSVNATIGIRYSFYDDDGGHGGPGTLLWGFGITHRFSQSSGEYYALMETHWPVLSPPIWTLHPRSSTPTIWGCFQVDNLGNSAADIDFMNRFSVLEYDGTPEFGSSQGMHFTSASSSDLSCTSNPGGTLTTSPGASFHRHLLFDDPRNLDVDVLWQDSFDWSGNGCGLPWHSQ